MPTFHNPILPGFYPDPSICRVEDDYYLVASSFVTFPGLPIFHSRDLVHWRQIGHALDRPDQIDLAGLGVSRGIWAPTIRHHAGVFYIVTTRVANDADFTINWAKNGNFLLRATDPAGPWSEPFWLHGATGIDPSLFFDDDERVYVTANRSRSGSNGFPEREIWLQEIDMLNMQLVGERSMLWDGGHDAQYVEAPHLYKREGWYYLLIAEGGTFRDHAVAVARSREVHGPYEPCPHNPIVSHRDMPDHTLACVGHADLVETGHGEWWAVLLGTRPVDGFSLLGRETLLAPVQWADGWPLIGLDGRISLVHTAPDLPAHPWPTPPVCDDFDAATLDARWVTIGTPHAPFWSLDVRPGFLRLYAQPASLATPTVAALMAQRVRHHQFTAEVALDLTQLGEAEAGLALFQNEHAFITLGVVHQGLNMLARLTRCVGGATELLAECVITHGPLQLRIVGEELAFSFHVASAGAPWLLLAEDIDGRLLSSEQAGGFVGVLVGLYARGANPAHADVDWFAYHGQDFPQSDQALRTQAQG